MEQLVSGRILEVKVKLSWNLKGNKSKFFLHIGWTWRDGDQPDLEVGVDAIQGFLRSVSAEGSQFVTMDDVGRSVEDENRHPPPKALSAAASPLGLGSASHSAVSASQGHSASPPLPAWAWSRS